MPESQVAENTRLNNSSKAELIELKRVVTALVKAIKEYENESGEVIMPQGDYYGVKFED